VGRRVGQVVDGTGGQRSGVGAGELETINAMLRSVIDGIADPVYAKDAEGRYLLVNPAAAAGLRPDQIVGSTDAQLLPGPVAASLRAADRWVMTSELPARSREELATPGGPRVYQALKAPWRDAGGRIAGVVGVKGGRLHPAVEIALFRVAQQALANVADHARATEVELRLEQSPAGDVLLAVGDDGCGFDPARVAGGGGGYRFGLTVMSERVEALGGRLAVRARDRGGTTVEACIPGPEGRSA
jgi:PAS fold/Histidine kinase-, DNA gyrase B-, and HSP90-like ATPase